jgi:hypothetical protein
MLTKRKGRRMPHLVMMDKSTGDVRGRAVKF